MAKLGRGDGRLDGRRATCKPRRPVLDLDGRVLRRRALHGDEHHEQRPHALRLRDRHRRHGRHEALALASGKPTAIVDWNNNYGDDPDKGVLFHCSNLPKDVFAIGRNFFNR